MTLTAPGDLANLLSGSPISRIQVESFFFGSTLSSSHSLLPYVTKSRRQTSHFKKNRLSSVISSIKPLPPYLKRELRIFEDMKEILEPSCRTIWPRYGARQPCRWVIFHYRKLSGSPRQAHPLPYRIFLELSTKVR